MPTFDVPAFTRAISGGLTQKKEGELRAEEERRRAQSQAIVDRLRQTQIEETRAQGRERRERRRRDEEKAAEAAKKLEEEQAAIGAAIQSGDTSGLDPDVLARSPAAQRILQGNRERARQEAERAENEARNQAIITATARSRRMLLAGPTPPKEDTALKVLQAIPGTQGLTQDEILSIWQEEVASLAKRGDPEQEKRDRIRKRAEELLEFGGAGDLEINTWEEALNRAQQEVEQEEALFRGGPTSQGGGQETAADMWERLVAAGVPPDQATQQVQARFGG